MGSCPRLLCLCWFGGVVRVLVCCFVWIGFVDGCFRVGSWGSSADGCAS